MLRGPLELPLGLTSPAEAVSEASSSPSPEVNESGERGLGFGILLPRCCFKNRSFAGFLSAPLIFGGAVPTLLLRSLFVGLLMALGLRTELGKRPLGESSLGGLGLLRSASSGSKSKVVRLLSKLTLLTLIAGLKSSSIWITGNVMLSFSSLKLTVLPLVGGGVGASTSPFVASLGRGDKIGVGIFVGLTIAEVRVRFGEVTGT